MVNITLPPLMRFLSELGYWSWMLILALDNPVWWVPLILSLLSLSLINFPGDKKPADIEMPGIYVQGWVRSLVELLWGLIGIYAAFQLGIVYFSIQVILVPLSLILDFERHLWMFGKRDIAPDYVTSIHK